jgi:hypothetical protein
MAAWVGALGLDSRSEPGTAIPAFVGAAILLISIGVLTGKLVSARRIG